MRLAPCSALAVLAVCISSVPALRASTQAAAPQAATASTAAATPEALQQRLEGKTVYLRGFYQEDHLEFDSTGRIKSNSSRGSFALSAMQIRKVRFTKRTMEIEADRIGLHFFGALPDEDDTKTFEMLKVSKKPVEISIDRLVIEPEKKKKKDKEKDKLAKAQATTNGNAGQQPASKPIGSSGAQSTPAQLGAEDAKNAAPDRAHDPQESYRQLSVALDSIFSNSLDGSVIGTLPGYWQSYFATKVGKTRSTSLSSAAFHPGGDVTAPRLLTAINPESNEYAQRNGIAGMILLQTVVSPAGRPGPVTIVRPIGFGLDERAVEAVERSQFRPGTKDGKPVPVLVNLAVTFRIYSDMTRPRHGQPADAAPVSSPTAPRSDPRGNQTTVAAVTLGR